MAKQEKPIKVPHPEFGYVEFHNLSPRQQDVIRQAKINVKILKTVNMAHHIKRDKK